MIQIHDFQKLSWLVVSTLWKSLVKWNDYSQYMGKSHMFQTINQPCSWWIPLVFTISMVSSYSCITFSSGWIYDFPWHYIYICVYIYIYTYSTDDHRICGYYHGISRITPMVYYGAPYGPPRPSVRAKVLAWPGWTSVGSESSTTRPTGSEVSVVGAVWGRVQGPANVGGSGLVLIMDLPDGWVIATFLANMT